MTDLALYHTDETKTTIDSWHIVHVGLSQLVVIRCSYLSQHLVVLHVVHLIGTDLSFQSILIEFTADVDQQRGWAGIDRTAQCDIANIPRNVDAVS